MLKGKIDRQSGRKSIYGYALNTDDSVAIQVDIVIDLTTITTTSDIYKEKLFNKYGHGAHAFKITIPENFKDNAKHIIQLLDSKTKIILDKCELVFPCSLKIKSQHNIPSVQNKFESIAKYNVINAEGFDNTSASIIIKNSIDYIPKVSVIIPVYNTSSYLDRCLKSVLNQTLSEIELIVIDDGSTDDSLTKLIEYAGIDKRISVVTQDNNYAGTARNAGIEIAKGKYLAFLDSDDFFDTNMIKEAYSLAESENSDIVCFQFRKFDDEKQSVLDKKEYGISLPQNNNKFISYSPKDKELSYRLFSSTNPAPWNKLFKKELIDKFRIKFQSLKASNDLYFTFSNLFLSKKITYLFKALAFYRINTKNNLTNSGKRGLDFYSAYKCLREKLTTQKSLPVFESSFLNCYISSSCWEYEHSSVDNKQKIRDILKSIIRSYMIDYMKVLPKFLSEKVRNILSVKISVIICAYNHELYIEECLKSVVNQTLKDIEIICINDGSTDNTLSIMKKYEKIDSRIIVIDQKNQGPSVGRNKALEISSGEYVQFLDSDDYIRRDTCEMLYHRAKELDLDTLFFSGYNFDSNSRELVENKYWSFSYLPAGFNKELFSIDECRNFVHRMAVSACLSAYKLDFIKDNKISFPEGLLFEDNLFFVSAVLKAKRISILNEKLYYRRVHEKSITQNWENNYSDYLEIVSKVLKKVESLTDQQCVNNYKNTYLSTCINRFNSFSDESKDRYYPKLKLLLDTYNYSNSKIQYKKVTDSLNVFYNLPIDLQKYIQARIDIRFFRDSNLSDKANSISLECINDKNATITSPSWCNTHKVEGRVITSISGQMSIRLKCSGKGKLVIHLRGIDFSLGKEKKVRFPIYIDFRSFVLNGLELLKSNSYVADHDHPFEYAENIDNSKEYNLNLKWMPLSRNSLT